MMLILNMLKCLLEGKVAFKKAFDLHSSSSICKLKNLLGRYSVRLLAESHFCFQWEEKCSFKFGGISLNLGNSNVSLNKNMWLPRYFSVALHWKKNFRILN